MIGFLASRLSKGFGALGAGVKKVCISLHTKQILWRAEAERSAKFLSDSAIIAMMA